MKLTLTYNPLAATVTFSTPHDDPDKVFNKNDVKIFGELEELDKQWILEVFWREIDGKGGHYGHLIDINERLNNLDLSSGTRSLASFTFGFQEPEVLSHSNIPEGVQT